MTASNDVVERIAAVLRGHHACHERCVVNGKEHCAGCNYWVVDHDAHVTAAVVAELQLTEEKGVHMTWDEGYVKSRWVTGWEAE